MNVKDPLPIFLFGTFIAVLLLLSGHIRNTVKLYVIFSVGSLIDYGAEFMEPTVFAMLVSVMAVFICLAVPVIMAFILVFRTTKISEFLSAFQKIKVPALVTIPFAVMFRFIPTVHEEWTGIRQAMAFRGIGLTPFKLIFHPIITAEHMLVPLLSSCVGIMDELVAASLVRGLDSDKKRNCYLTIKMGVIDYIVLLFNFGFFVVMIYYFGGKVA